MPKLDLKILYPHLGLRNFPDPRGSTVTLPDGRLLGYIEYIDPVIQLSDEPDKHVTTMVLIPGCPGSRFFTHPSVRAKNFIPGVRLIVLERSGLGLSSPSPNKPTPAAFAADFNDFCHALSLSSVLLLGYSAGTPYALAAAALAKPGVVSRLALVCPIAPLEAPNTHQGMALMFRFAYLAAQYFPPLIRWAVWHDQWAGKSNPVGSLRDSLYPYTSSCKEDAATLARPEVEEMFLESAMELGARDQAGAIAAETLCWAGGPWGVSCADVAVATRIWQGSRDAGCTPAMGAYLANTIPNCTLTVVPGGHFIYFDVFQEVVSWLLDATLHESRQVNQEVDAIITSSIG